MRFRIAASSLLLSALVWGAPVGVRAQASAIPSAQAGPDVQGTDRGRKLLDEMIAALGGDAWLKRTDWTAMGKGATFYKGSANPYVAEFELYERVEPFGERIVMVSRDANAVTALIGVPMSKAKRDVAEVWTLDNGYEVTFRGKKALPAEDVADFQRRRKHTLDVVVRDWLKQPGVLVSYEGTSMVDRHLVDKLSVLTATNDGVELLLDATTHLPRSLSFTYRNATYKDLDTDTEQFDDIQPVQGIMTPLTVTRLHNGDMTSQRFLTKVTYNNRLSPDLFNPDRPLEKKK